MLTEEEDVAEISPATMEFALEAHMEEFLVGNWSARVTFDLAPVSGIAAN